MTHLLAVILDDLEHMPYLLKAWWAIGVPGVTILESVGADRASKWLSRMGLEALDRLFEAKGVSRRTLLAAIEDEDLLARAIAEAERVVGGFDRPHSGLLLALPVAQARGLHKVQSALPQQEPPRQVAQGHALDVESLDTAELITDHQLLRKALIVMGG